MIIPEDANEYLKRIIAHIEYALKDNRIITFV